MSDAPAPADRAQLLAHRVRWLDRYRRGIAVVVAVVVALLLMRELSDLLGADWPQFHATLLSAVAAVFAWWTLEVSLAWLTAVWETEYDRLIRERGLPRAELIRPRRN